MRALLAIKEGFPDMLFQRFRPRTGSRGCRPLLTVGLLTLLLGGLAWGSAHLASSLLAQFGTSGLAAPTLTSLSNPATATPVPGYQPQPQDDLTSISMISASEGWAVGTSLVSGESYEPLLLHYNGRFWEQNDDLTNADLQAKRAGLQHVFMISQSEGWAVGNLDWESTTASTTSAAFILHFQGGHWSLQGTFDGSLQSLWMTSASDGWAVGSQGTEIGSTLLLHYDGHTWTPVSAPGAGLSQVVMTSKSNGWAIGFAAGAYIGQSNSLLLHYTGRSWKAVSGPQVESFTALAMDTASDGWIVGTRNQNTQTVFAHFTGQSWAEIRPSLSATTNASITSLSLTSASEGWAIGVLQAVASSGNSSRTLYLHWHNGQWTQVDGPNAGWVNSLFFVSASEGWGVGKGGIILHEQQGVWNLVMGTPSQ